MDRERFALVKLPASDTAEDVTDHFAVIRDTFSIPPEIPLIIQSMVRDRGAHGPVYTVLISWWEWSSHAEKAQNTEEKRSKTRARKTGSGELFAENHDRDTREPAEESR